MKQLTIFLFLCTLFGGYSQNNTKPQLDHSFTIHSNILKENRTCLISLPEGYNNPENAKKKYPIAIVLDGKTFYKTVTGVVHFMSSVRNRNHFMPETIVVAVINVDRERDFTFTKIKTKRKNTMGGGKKFLSFLEKELVVLLNYKYRTEPYTTLIGHSLGGLFVLNAYINSNTSFDNYLAIDPSIWWTKKAMIEKIATINPGRFTKRLYIATANQGKRNYIRNQKKHQQLATLLEQKSEGKIPLKLSYFENEDHRSVPLVALYEGLFFLNEEY